MEPMTEKTSSARKISIEFGALVRPISEQLKSQGIEIQGADRFDKLADAITRLYLNNMIPESVCDSARKKLMNEISREFHK